MEIFGRFTNALVWYRSIQYLLLTSPWQFKSAFDANISITSTCCCFNATCKGVLPIWVKDTIYYMIKD